MSKNKVKNSRRHSLNLPEIVNMDHLAVMTDDELSNRLQVLESDLQKIVDSFQETRPWETEIAYVRREMQLRKSRRDFHDSYLKTLPNREDDNDYNYSDNSTVEMN